MRSAVLPVIVMLAGCGRAKDVSIEKVPLALDREERLADQPLSASTQSINRYRSVLSRFDAVDVTLDGRSDRLRVGFREKGAPTEALRFENVDPHFVVPLLDYPHDRKLSPFDRQNLMLAEYSRNGVELAHQDSNREYGYVTSKNLFNDDEEYAFQDGKVVPNPGARPKRMSLVNNCLTPGLWELSGADSVGELYHAWLTLPEHDYFELVRSVNQIDAGDEELKAALGYQKELPRVVIDFERLRARVRSWGKLPATVNPDKKIGSYSTQDSRRKVQRKFFHVERAGVTITPATFGELKPGDLFQFHSFVPPGIYTQKTPRTVVYEPIWTEVELAEVTPKTRFLAPSPHPYTLGAIELTFTSSDGTRALVVGNLPVDLLVMQEDFDVPGFGVGVLRASEPIEKRYLYFKDGPAPVYAYSAFVRDGKLEIANNHEQGLEQIYLRPYRRGDDVILRVTLVAYERILDLMELEVKLPPELGAKILKASANYQRPLWRSFSDSNLL
jgi:hypothetical protein